MHHAFGKSARGHDFTGKDKEGDGHQRVVVGPVQHAAGNDHGVPHAGVPHEHHGAEHQHQTDGNAEGQEEEQGAEKDEKFHVLPLCLGERGCRTTDESHEVAHLHDQGREGHDGQCAVDQGHVHIGGHGIGVHGLEHVDHAAVEQKAHGDHAQERGGDVHGGRKVDADVLVATDPDADRLGVEIRQPDGSYLNLSGNQIGAIIAKYILEAHKTAGTLPANAALCKSIVSTELVTKIAESYGATMFNVLTGFKFIGEKIHEFETQHNHTYMLGFEESFGYLIKPFVRDKDAIQAVLIVAEIAAYYRSRGMTLADGIEEIYKQYGYFAEKTISVTLSGVDGAAEIKKIMDKFRGNAPKQFNNTDIAKTEDFLEQTATTADGVEKLTTPPSNVLKYILADDSWFAVRPSGTEPKIKFYIATVGESEADAKEKIANIEAEINAFVGE